MNKSAIREVTFKLLYSIEIQKELEEEELNIFLNEMEVNSDDIRAKIIKTIETIQKNKEQILSQISMNLKSEWKLERISKVNISLLKLAIYEMLYKKVPYKIVINEVVELAKKYGEDTSSSFINGVLATIVKQNNLETKQD